MQSPDPLVEVETSPDGRYVRFDKHIGRGSYKDVWLAYDSETGSQVAWNTVNLTRMSASEQKRISGETEILKRLSHTHIMKFYEAWSNEEKQQVCFITELLNAGTLRQYFLMTAIKLKVIKKYVMVNCSTCCLWLLNFCLLGGVDKF